MTELEGVVLGVVWSRGPCSAYAVRQRFSNSPTAAWSASTGAIYPAIRRLEARGLLTGSANGDARGTRNYVITATGTAALRNWILELSEWMGGSTIDPVRSRAVYLGAMDKSERDQFIDAAERNARAALARVQLWMPDPRAKQPWGLKAAALGAELEILARLQWIERLREMSGEQTLGSSCDSDTLQSQRKKVRERSRNPRARSSSPM